MVATIADIPYLARRMYLEKDKTCFAGYVNHGWTVPACALHLEQALEGPASYVAVSRGQHHIMAACGATLIYSVVPPQFKIVMEWMWFGESKRETVKVWHECEAWGKTQGAELSQCGLNKRQVNPSKWVEYYKWRVL